MYVFFVYATHKKTELVWKIQPRFVFFFALEHSVSGSKFWISDQQFEKKVKNNYFASQLCGLSFASLAAAAAAAFNRLIPTSMYLLFQHTLKIERNKY